jgi:DNA-binding NtrC family response regulator
MTEDELARLNLVGESPAFRRATTLIGRVARFDATTLILGETGTGKELAARAIHYLGLRRDHPFVPINCGGMPDTLLENELFGHERGAFTDARERRDGLLNQARGGTLFLDEIEAMSPRAQVVLLRFLQDQRFRPLGSSTVVTGNVRLIAAGNADLAAMVRGGQFRRDLFFRLSVLVVRLPPLRERPGDSSLLAKTFLCRFSRAYGISKRLAPTSFAWLEEQEWPGNVRELENLILREYLLGEGPEIDLRHPVVEAPIQRTSVSEEPPPPSPAATGPAPRGSAASARRREESTGQGTLPFRQAKAAAVAEFERAYLEGLLAEAGGNFSLAARQAGKDRTTLRRLLRRHGLDPQGRFDAS